MKRLSKVILSLIVVGVIAFALVNNKKELNVNDIDSKKLAVFIKQEDGSYKESTSIPQMGYTLNTNKSTCSNGAKPTWINNTLNLSNLTSNNTNCYLYFDKLSGITIQDIIAMNNPKSTTPTTFETGATTDEGVYSVSDPVYGGTSYYWRGAVTNNYVKFADKCWRIVRINGDGSIRLIYDGTTCHANGANSDSIAVASTAYNTNYNNSSYVGWTYTASTQRTLSGTASNAKSKLESWYSSNITGTNATKVASGKYCNDRNTGPGGSTTTWSATGTTFYYAAYNRINTGAPTLSCPSGDVYTLNVGLITADEVMYAGGKFANNSSYYLYNGQNYWTMSPYRWNSGGHAYVFIVNLNGNLGNDWVSSGYGLRPVINLKSDTLFATGGNGTQSNPFIVQ